MIYPKRGEFQAPRVIESTASMTGVEVLDTTRDQLAEIFLIRNPQLRSRPQEIAEPQKIFVEKNMGRGVWFYFPWKNQVVRVLPPKLHQELRTARNKLLITDVEQEKFRKCKVAVAGLSIGGSVAYTLAVTGGCEFMKLADPDEISGSNLNRLRATVSDIGRNKAFVAAEQIYGLNPFAKLELYPAGVDQKNMAKFLSGIDVLVDEMDDLEMKILIRLEVRKRGLPVVMATDNADGVMLDVERFDKDSEAALFHGTLDERSLLKEIREGGLSGLTRVKAATTIVGVKNIPSRMLRSLLLVGKRLYSWPQLGSSAFTAGASVAFAVRAICLDYPLESGRYLVSYEKILLGGQAEEERAHERMTRLFKSYG